MKQGIEKKRSFRVIGGFVILKNSELEPSISKVHRQSCTLR